MTVESDDTITMPKVTEGSAGSHWGQNPVLHRSIPTDLQAEIAAMYAVVAALEPLDNQARSRVLKWVRESLNITL